MFLNVFLSQSLKHYWFEYENCDEIAFHTTLMTVVTCISGQWEVSETEKDAREKTTHHRITHVICQTPPLCTCLRASTRRSAAPGRSPIPVVLSLRPLTLPWLCRSFIIYTDRSGVRAENRWKEGEREKAPSICHSTRPFNQCGGKYVVRAPRPCLFKISFPFVHKHWSNTGRKRLIFSTTDAEITDKSR